MLDSKPADIESMTTRGALKFAVFYAALSLISLLVAAPLTEVDGSWVSLLWLLGPPVTLVHGMEFAWAFGLGTLLFAPAFAVAVYGTSRGARATAWIFAIFLWFLGGFFVYAPGH